MTMSMDYRRNDCFTSIDLPTGDWADSGQKNTSHFACYGPCNRFVAGVREGLIDKTTRSCINRTAGVTMRVVGTEKGHTRSDPMIRALFREACLGNFR
jgi:hypothetical protein